MHIYAEYIDANPNMSGYFMFQVGTRDFQTKINKQRMKVTSRHECLIEARSLVKYSGFYELKDKINDSRD